MTRTLLVIVVSTFALVSVAEAATIRGYVVDADGHRVRGARVQAWHMVPTDQRPPQHPTKLGETISDAHGDFVMSVDARQTNMLIASFDRQSGAAAPSFTTSVRIALRHIRPRPVI
jgi:hypothetical protein